MCQKMRNIFSEENSEDEVLVYMRVKFLFRNKEYFDDIHLHYQRCNHILLAVKTKIRWGKENPFIVDLKRTMGMGGGKNRSTIPI